MNIQTEHQENHTTRLTVQVETERVEKALREAARRISRKARIKGFRPGKAPYDVILNLYGREYVLGEALETLGNEIYREALDESEIEPYAPGNLEDVNEDDGLTLTFIVPRRPTVELGDYRAIRIEHEVEEVTDKMVEEALEQLREQHVVLEDVERPAEMGDKITLAHFEVVQLDDETASDDADEEDEQDKEDEAPEADEDVENEDAEDEDGADEEALDEDEDNVLIHQHNYAHVLSDDDRDLFPGFSAQLVGLSAGDEKEFELQIPDDYEMDDIAGATLRCEAHVEKVEARTVPEWTDDLAKTISEEEFDTLLDLRVDVRKKLEQAAENQAQQRTAEAALEKLVEDATIQYPEELVDETTSEILNDLDMNLRQQGINLEDFIRITGRQESELRAQYRDRAVERAERSLALSQLVEDEELTISEDDIDTEIKRMAGSLGGNQTDQLMQFLNSAQNRMNISNRLATDRVVARLVAIARGENPAKGPDPVEETTEEVEVIEAEAEALEAEETPAETVATDESATETEASTETENPE